MAERAKRSGLHEAELGDAGYCRIQDLGRLWPLQREQRLLPHMIDDHVAEAAFHVFDVDVLGGAVDNDVKIVAPARRHQIVDDPAVLVEEQRIFGLHVLRIAKIARHHALERRGDPASVDE